MTDSTAVRGYPSDAVPEQLHVHLRTPVDWDVRLLPGALFALTAPEREGEFTANVLVTTARVSQDATAQSAYRQLVPALERLPGYECIGSGPRSLAGLAGIAHDAAFRVPDGTTLVQCHWIAAVPRGLSNDLLHITGTAAADHGHRDLPVLRDAIASLAIVVP